MERILFLDIDGVLNPFAARSGLHGDWHKAYLSASEPERGRYWVSVEVGAWLRHLLDSEVRIVWATTWINHSADLERYGELLGLPPNLERIRLPPIPEAGSTESGKRSGISEWLTSNTTGQHNRLALWIDDQIGPGDRAFAANEKIVVVRPSPASGLANRKLRDQIAAQLVQRRGI